MSKWVRGPTLTLVGVAAIASVYVGWSGSAGIHTARSLPAFADAVTPAPPALARVSAAVPRPPLFAFCGDGACPAGAQGAGDGCDTCLTVIDAAPVEVRFAAFSESSSPLSADFGFGVAPHFDGGLGGTAPSSLEPGATAAPAPEISTAAMVALGVVFLTTRRRKRWAAWKAPWKTAEIPSVC